MADQKNIKQMTVVELKALAYDFVSELDRLRNNLSAINAEIELKSKEEKKPELKKG